MELGKIAFVLVNLKLQGMLITTFLLSQYIFFVVIYEPIIHSISQQPDLRYAILSTISAILTLVSIFILWPVMRK